MNRYQWMFFCLLIYILKLYRLYKMRGEKREIQEQQFYKQMKELSEAQYIDNTYIKLESISTQQQNDTQRPQPGYDYLSVFYKNRIYVIGGTNKDSIKKYISQLIYWYDLQLRQWTKEMTKTYSEQIQMFRGNKGVALGSRWFIYGRNRSETGNQTKLWKLNFDNLDWIKCQQRGNIPIFSEGSNFVNYDKNWLITYGGYKYIENNLQQGLYLYNIDSKNWHLCQSNYRYCVKARFQASMISVNNKLYLFGGYTKNCDGVQFLNDFYQISLRVPTKNLTAQAYFRKICSLNRQPFPRAEHHMLYCGGNIICILGGKKQKGYDSSIWTFNLILQEWKYLDTMSKNLLMREGISYTEVNDKTYIFGGLDSFDDQSHTNTPMKADLWLLSINHLKYYGSNQMIRKITTHAELEYSPKCRICFKQKNYSSSKLSKFSSQIIDASISLIEFPFAAFGLLVDNSHSLGASYVNITIDSYNSDKEHFIRFQDNGKCNWTDDQYIQGMVGFDNPNQLILIGCDKKSKKIISKQNLRKEYGINIKLGCLRLGKKFLVISIYGDLVRISLCYKSSQQESKQHCGQSQSQHYILQFYSYDVNNSELQFPETQVCRDFIEKTYKKYIREATANHFNKNVVYIFETIINSQSQPIFTKIESNDIFFGSKMTIDDLMNIGYNLYDCIDVSLRAYLSVLYLRNQIIKIGLGIKHSLTTASLQGFIQKIDKLCKSGTAIQLDGIIEFDFKMAEFYFLRQMKKNSLFFSNGVLLYNRNRLITRYRPQLGTLIEYINAEGPGLINHLPLFGYAELPENIPINYSKTNFSFNVMIEKMYSRLKFVQIGLKKRSNLSQKIHLSSLQRREKITDRYPLQGKRRGHRKLHHNISDKNPGSLLYSYHLNSNIGNQEEDLINKSRLLNENQQKPIDVDGDCQIDLIKESNLKQQKKDSQNKKEFHASQQISLQQKEQQIQKQMKRND